MHLSDSFTTYVGAFDWLIEQLNKSADFLLLSWIIVAFFSEPEEVKFLRPLSGQIVLGIGMRHELECLAEGQPEPQYVWLKDNDVIDGGDDLRLVNSTR